MDDQKTLYSLANEHGERSTITLEKWVADILQNEFPDVHDWMQDQYDKIVIKKPHLGRRLQGDLVRALAIKQALDSPTGRELIKDL